MQDFDQELASTVSEIRDRYPGLPRDKAFVFWFIQAFLTEDPSQAINSVVGGKDDKNIDAIYIDNEVRNVFVVQGKYRQNRSKREDRSDIVAFTSVADFLLGSMSKFRTIVDNADEGMRPLLEHARRALLQQNYQLALQYVTTGKVSGQHADEAEEYAAEHQRVTFQVFDGRALQRLMQDYIDGAAPPVPTVRLRVEGNEAFDSFDEKIGVQSWVFSVNGKELGDLFNRYGIRIFARNIRGFLGSKTSVNQAMTSTVGKEPDIFWYYNNGATIVCDAARQIKERGRFYLSISNAQIINGQQTTRTLARISGSGKVKVLMRVIAVPRSSQKDFTHYNQLVSEIVKATNSQNAIKLADLVANDAEQIRIERELKKLGYFYARKTMTKGEMRAHYGARNRQIIKRDDLVMAIASCTTDPSIVRRGKQQFFVTPYYEKLFDGRPIYEYLVLYWLYVLTKYIYRGRGLEIGYSRHLVNYTLWKEMKRHFSKKSRSQALIDLVRGRRYGTLKSLSSMIEILMKEVMRCYRKNNKYEIKISDGKVGSLKYAEIDYFKRAATLREWNKHWSAEAAESARQRFLRFELKAVDVVDEWADSRIP